jgi:hypothetical protein
MVDATEPAITEVRMPLARFTPVLLIAAAVVHSQALAQTTPTERLAAREIIQQIDALQERLQPGETARRLAGTRDRERDDIFARIEELWASDMQNLSDHIGHNPEVGFKEFESVDTLTAVLTSFGFSVETGLAGLATAFAATWESPAGTSGPTLGVIVEYDALRSTRGSAPGCRFHRTHRPCT